MKHKTKNNVMIVAFVLVLLAILAYFVPSVQQTFLQEPYEMSCDVSYRCSVQNNYLGSGSELQTARIQTSSADYGYFTNRAGSTTFKEGDSVQYKITQTDNNGRLYQNNCQAGISSQTACYDSIRERAGQYGYALEGESPLNCQRACNAEYVNCKLNGKPVEPPVRVYLDAGLSESLTAGTHEIGYVNCVTEVPFNQVSTPRIPLSGLKLTRQRVNVAPLPCVLSDNQMIVFQSFNENSPISKVKLQYPLSKTCGSLKPLVSDLRTLTAYHDCETLDTDFCSNILTKLNNNQVYTVPEGKVISLAYVADKPSYLSAVCSSDEVFLAREGYCAEFGAITYSCPEGTIQPNGACVTSAKISEECSEGQLTVDSDGSKICWVILPVREVDGGLQCSDGKKVNSASDCIKLVDLKYQCDKGNLEKQDNGEYKCVIKPSLLDSSQLPLYVTLGIFAILLIVGLIYWRKK